MTFENVDFSSPSLPSLATTHGGSSFDPREMVWDVRDPVSTLKADFRTIQELIGPQLTVCFKATLVWTIARNSSSHTDNLFDRFLHFVKHQAVRIAALGCLTRAIFLDYRASLTPQRQWYASTLAVLLRYWNDLGHGGLASDLIECLDTIVLPGNSQGHHVRSRDKTHGPLSEFEFQFCWSILDNAYAAGEIDEADHLLLSLEMALGTRPVQLAALRVCDVGSDNLPNGQRTHFIDVPRAKNRLRARSESKRRPLPPALGKALEDYSYNIALKFDHLLDDARQAPLFPAVSRIDSAPAGWEFHQTNAAVSRQIKLRWRVVLDDVQSLRITARRLRYTLGTRAAQEGHGVYVIAEMLDHSTTSSARVYVEATPEVTTRINRAMASRLGAISRLFRGRLIGSEDEATRVGDRSSRIEDYRIDAPTHTMGNCGNCGPCGLLAPIACYTCPSFEAWIDGPHESILEHLLTERDRLMDQGEPRLASVLDLQIAAAAKVVDMCKAMGEGAKS